MNQLTVELYEQGETYIGEYYVPAPDRVYRYFLGFETISGNFVGTSATTAHPVDLPKNWIAV